MELLSVIATSQPASQPQPVPEPESESQSEQIQSDDVITDLTVEQDDAPEGNNPDPPSATDAPMLSEEA